MAPAAPGGARPPGRAGGHRLVPCGGVRRDQLGPRLQRLLGDQRVEHPFHLLAVQLVVLGGPADRRPDAEALQSRSSSHARPAGGRRGSPPRCRRPPRPPGRARGRRRWRPPVDPVLSGRPCRRGRSCGSPWLPGCRSRMAFAVRPLQMAHHRAVPVGPPRLPRVHAYTSPTQRWPVRTLAIRPNLSIRCGTLVKGGRPAPPPWPRTRGRPRREPTGTASPRPPTA